MTTKTQTTNDQTSDDGEQFDFQAEVSKLLNMMVHSVYSDKDIFLRELISNAADACDRRRYEALQNPKFLCDQQLQITVFIREKEKQIIVSDNGVGMNRQELVDHLGVIAHSGTAKMVEKMAQKQKGGDQKTGEEIPDLIGQFGVGFYSAFMVADHVQVISRRIGEDEAWSWQSSGIEHFKIAPVQRDQAGTDIILHLKEDAESYLDSSRLKQIISLWSGHIQFPIMLAVDDQEPEMANTGQALWTLPKNEISKEQYAEFYKSCGGWLDQPARTLHFRAEGKLDYIGLLFIPSKADQNLYDPERKSQLRLYVKRVFITDQCQDLLPPWLRFVKGVIDSADISLNISREMLQNNPVLGAIQKAITSRILSELEKFADDNPEDYIAFWKEFGKVIKEGLYESTDRQDKLLNLVRFQSLESGESWIGLHDYISKMKPDQEAIYYLASDKSNTPHLEGYRSKGYDVLFLPDAIDDFWTGMVGRFEDKPFESITRADSSPEDKQNEPKDGAEKQDPGVDLLLARLRSDLGEYVTDVKASTRLTDSPVCLVAQSGGMDLRMQRLLQMHNQLQEKMRPILEVNPDHVLIKQLVAKLGDKDQGELVTLAAHVLLDEARLLEGETIDDVAGFAGRLNDLLTRLLG